MVQKMAIDAWWSGPYTKGMGSPLVLGEPSHREFNQGDLLSSVVDAAQFDIALVRRRFWKTATFQEQVGVRTGSRYGEPLDVASCSACRRASRGVAFRRAPLFSFLGGTLSGIAGS